MLFYVYYFALKVDGHTEEKVVYAASEDEARKQFKEDFGVEAGELLRRTHW